MRRRPQYTLYGYTCTMFISFTDFYGTTTGRQTFAVFRYYFFVFKFVVETTLGAHTKSHICRKTTAIARKGKIRNTRTTNGTHTQTHSKQPSQYIPKHSRAAQTESISTFVPIFLFSHTHTWAHVSSSSTIH